GAAGAPTAQSRSVTQPSRHSQQFKWLSCRVQMEQTTLNRSLGGSGSRPSSSGTRVPWHASTIPHPLRDPHLLHFRPCRVSSLNALRAGAREVWQPALKIGFGKRLVLARLLLRSLQTPAVTRHGEAKHEIDHPHHDIDLDAEALPGRIDDCGFCRCEQVEDADDEDQSCILEESDEGIDKGRNDMAQRLREDDESGPLPIGEAKSLGAFGLTFGHGL